jgi:hypothetical protein
MMACAAKRQRLVQDNRLDFSKVRSIFNITGMSHVGGWESREQGCGGIRGQS